MSVADSNPGTFLSLSQLVAPLRPLVRRRLDACRDSSIALGSRGYAVTAAHYGAGLVDIQPLFINLGALAIKSDGAPATYLMRPSASQVVHDTDLRSIPEEPPRMLLRPGIVEARRPDTGERLWDDVVSLAWYSIDGAEREPPQLLPATFIVGLRWPDGIFAAQWRPAWTGENLDDQLPSPEWGASLLETVEIMEHNKLAKQSARFLVVLSLLEQVDDGPLQFEIDPATKQMRNVRVRDFSAKGLRAPTRPRPSKPLVEPLPDGRALELTKIRGHLRRFHVGEGRKKVQWRFIRDHQGRRWFAPRYTVERNFAHPGLANASVVFRPRQ